ncbi:sulfotransferase family protein [Actinomadura monticuli]|uniref:Sulfotransferase n=1 Tax=Actinomadura monticuli TaxID=3097367 RepID=A0ABV4Q5S4_9ACTN
MTAPTAEIRPATVARLTELRGARGPAVAGFTSRVRELVVVASSSRGGSSMLADLLRESDALVHLRAELNPFLRLVGLGCGENGAGSDRLGPGDLAALDPGRRRFLDAELALDTGAPASTIGDPERFAHDVAWRVIVQWPDIAVSPQTVVPAVRRVVRRLVGADGRLDDPAGFLVALVAELRAAGLPVRTSAYDLPATMRERRGGGEAPSRRLVEEPPFILPRAWRTAAEADLAQKPLVVKTPSNAYRLPFLRALFPHARIRVLHLTRNPAAAVNGLYDGWRYPAFHSHHVDDPLDIAGYSELHPDNRWWWKFDLPPGWETLTRRPLLEVCASQWRSAHRAILADLAEGTIDHLRIRFEDLVAGGEPRMRTMTRLVRWLGIPWEEPLRTTARLGIRPVSATAPPRARRWRDRGALVRAALDEETMALAEELGYSDERDWL